MPMQPLLRSAELAIEAVPHWTPREISATVDDRGADATAYTGAANGWRFIVVAFSTEDQGFPPGSLGFDGTGTTKLGGKPTILRLTRELAEKAFRLAEAGAS